LQGETPFYAILRDARERAHQAGAKNVEEKSIVGAPINALVRLAEEVHADLLVVGNVGLSSVAGRLLGSVPSEVSRRAKTDVLIVHTADKGIVSAVVADGNAPVSATRTTSRGC
jgi:nucleotide-binding universal stress UspA family protein